MIVRLKTPDRVLLLLCCKALHESANYILILLRAINNLLSFGNTNVLHEPSRLLFLQLAE